MAKSKVDSRSRQIKLVQARDLLKSMGMYHQAGTLGVIEKTPGVRLDEITVMYRETDHKPTFNELERMKRSIINSMSKHMMMYVKELPDGTYQACAHVYTINEADDWHCDMKE